MKINHYHHNHYHHLKNIIMSQIIRLILSPFLRLSFPNTFKKFFSSQNIIIVTHFLERVRLKNLEGKAK
jgi:hypothetical protein